MRPCAPYPTCLSRKASYMLRFARCVSFCLRVFTEQYFVGWRFAYPTYKTTKNHCNPKEGLLVSCLLLFSPATHLYPFSFILYRLSFFRILNPFSESLFLSLPR